MAASLYPPGAADRAQADDRARIFGAISLEPGEHVIFQGHPSWRSILGFYVKALAVVVVAAAVAGVATKIADDAVHKAQRDADTPAPTAR